MLSCSNCNAGLRFAPELQKLKCDHCNSTFDVSAYDISNINYAYGNNDSAESIFEIDGCTYSCGVCGAEIYSDETTDVTFCSYCGSSVQLKKRVSKMMAPSLIIPFKTTKEDCIKSYKKLLKRSPFAPSYMKMDSNIDKLRGIYMPYWLFNYEYSGTLAYIGSKSSVTNGIKTTTFYNINAVTDMNYKGISFDASSAFYDTFSSAISPFDYKDSENYNPGYLSGFYADASNINASAYESEARQLVIRDIGINLSRSKPFRKHAGDINSGYAKEGLIKESHQLAFLPVWFLSMRNKKDKISYAVINGQSGKMAADIPIDILKFFIGSLLLSVPITGGLLCLKHIKYVYIMLALILIALLLFAVADKQLNKVYTHLYLKNDKGYQIGKYGDVLADLKFASSNSSNNPNPMEKKMSERKKNTIVFIMLFGWYIFMIALFYLAPGKSAIPIFLTLFFTLPYVPPLIAKIPVGKMNKAKRKIYIFRQPVKEKIGVLIKPILTALICGAMILWNPANETYSFAGIIASSVLIFWTICDLIKAHNSLTQSSIPQFGRRE